MGKIPEGTGFFEAVVFRRKQVFCQLRWSAILFMIFMMAGTKFVFAAEKTPENDSLAMANPAPSAEQGSRSDVTSEGTGEDKLLTTLNETLGENRKIHQKMRDLQSAFEKVTIEKSDLALQVRRVQQFAIQRDKQDAGAIDAMTVQLNAAKKEKEKLQAENKIAMQQKQELDNKLALLKAERVKMQELLKGSILESERGKIESQLRKNEQSVQEAVTKISKVDRENIMLKEQLVQSYFEMGNVLYDLGRFQDAAVQYLHVLDWDPNHAWAHHNLAVIYDYHMHKIQEAKQHYQQYLQLKQSDEDAKEARIRLWDLQQLSNLEPDQPLKKDFRENLKV